METLVRKSSPEALRLEVVEHAYPGQFGIETRGPLEDFDREYFNVSGYFGEHGPHVFAVAPALLDCAETAVFALEELIEHLGDDMIDSRRARINEIQAIIALAKGEQTNG